MNNLTCNMESKHYEIVSNTYKEALLITYNKFIRTFYKDDFTIKDVLWINFPPDNFYFSDL